MHVHYINLARRPDRNKAFLAQLPPGISVERKTALDGRTLDVAAYEHQGWVSPQHERRTRGTLANAITHLLLWQDCKAAEVPYTICEDDALLNRNFAHEAYEILDSIEDDWDIITWGYNFNCINHLCLLPGVKNILIHTSKENWSGWLAAFKSTDYDALPYRLLAQWNTFCYTINNLSVDRLMAAVLPLRDELIPVPGLASQVHLDALDTMLSVLYHKFRSWSVLPPLAIVPHDKADSDVGWGPENQRDPRHIPGPADIALRPRTTDEFVWNEIFKHKVYDLELNFEPQYILDIGANIGCAAIWFTLKYPCARIVAIEPNTDNVRQCSRNCEPWQNIAIYHAAAWIKNGFLDLPLPDPNDCPVQYATIPTKPRAAGNFETVLAYSIDEIMRKQLYPKIDILKVDIEGVEKCLFEVENKPWLQRTNCVLVETHDSTTPGCSDAVLAAMPSAEWEHYVRQEVHTFVRRQPL